MGNLANRMRRIWQGYGGNHGQEAENYFYEAFKQAFEGTDFEVINKPAAKPGRTPLKPVQIHNFNYI